MLYYKEVDLKEIIKNALEVDGIIENYNKNENITTYYSDTIFTFDCEASSYYIVSDNYKEFKEGEVIDFKYELNKKYPKLYKDYTYKQGLMYIWMVGIGEIVIYGRTQEELHDLFYNLKDLLVINNIRIIPIFYIHNLGYDFNYILNSIPTQEFEEVFAREAHKPIYAKASWVEFRCSYFLTNSSLASFAKNYNLNVRKQEGDLDYLKIRTPLTELTDKELNYCEYDILVLKEIIKIYKNNYNSIFKIPYTKTGIVRRKFGRLFFNDRKYHDMINNALPFTFDDFLLLCDAFAGGYTHSNFINTNKIIENVISMDITSSYPYEICTKKYPMYNFVKKSDNSLKTLDKDNYAYIIDFTVNGLEATNNNHFLSVSKAYKQQLVKVKEDNGRIVSCEAGRFLLTDVDFNIYKQVYKQKAFKINNIYISRKEYLPLKIIQFVLEYYKRKTELKNIDEMISLYNSYKEDLNSIYGMFCTKILQDDILYLKNMIDKDKKETTLWKKHELTEEEANEKIYKLHEHDNNTNYSWGVWVTAYARNHLWRMILKLNDNLIYSDTDSVKFKYFDGYNKIFEEDNKKVNEDIYNICNFYKELSPIMFSPKDKNGVSHTLGYYDLDAKYKQFKTLGAKKYAFIKEGHEDIELTVSGVSKKKAKRALKTLDDFKNGFIFDCEYSDRLICYYNFDQKKTYFDDGWLDNSKIGVNLMPTTYKLSLTPDYEDYINISTSIIE